MHKIHGNEVVTVKMISVVIKSVLISLLDSGSGGEDSGLPGSVVSGE